MNKKRGNPKKQVKVSEAEYVRGRRDRERLLKIKKAMKPINQIVKNIEKVELNNKPNKK